MKKNVNIGDMRKNPLRGILTEIAKELDITPQAVWQQVFLTQNPKTIDLFNRKRSQRLKIIKKFEINK